MYCRAVHKCKKSYPHGVLQFSIGAFLEVHKAAQVGKWQNYLLDKLIELYACKLADAWYAAQAEHFV